MPQIKRILFPTNCSINAQKAFAYTLAVAKTFGASIDVLYVAKPKVDIWAPSVMRFSLLQEEKRNAEKKLDQWLKTFEVHNIPIHKEVEAGYAREIIGIYANEREDIGLSVMGINDEYSLMKIIRGTVVSATIDAANMPVLVVPKGIVFQDIRNMAYVTPLLRNWRAVLPQVEQIATNFAAKLLITHLQGATYEAQEGEEHIDLDDYASALNSLVYNTHLHLLVTMASNRSAMQRLFRYSKAQKMALTATIPLLVLKEQKV